MQFPEDDHRVKIGLYATPFIIFIGTIGNILAILVFSQKSLRGKSTSIFLIGLGVTDTVVLNLGLMPWWVGNVTGREVRTYADAICKIENFFSYAPIHSSAWILVAVTLERVIAVCLPMKARELVTPRRALISLVVIVVVISGVNAHLLWTNRLETNADGNIECIVDPLHWNFVREIFIWIDLFIASYIPFTIMLVCNAAIIFKLVKAKLKRKANMNIKDDSSKMSSVTIMLLTLNFVFLLTTSPIVIFLALKEVFKGDKSPQAMARYWMVYVIVGLLSYTNSALNFYMYCLSGAKFRRDLMSLFCKNPPPKKSSKIPQSKSTTTITTVSKSCSDVAISNGSNGTPADSENSDPGQ